MAKLNKEQILERGWSIDQFIFFAQDKKQIIKDNEQFWHSNYIEKVENQLVHQSLLNKNQQKTKESINFINSLEIDFKSGNHLLAKKDYYDALQPIFHLVKTDFEPNENGSYSVFTDGSFKTLNHQAFASCGGWIMDNNTREVIIEFSMPVPLDENRTRSMPKFELIGIYEAANLVKKLKLSNVKFYTDEEQESLRVFEKMHNIEKVADNENTPLYEAIAKIMNDTNSTISWISRDYNTHADEISEIPLNAWIKNNEGDYKNKDYIAENGYVVDREKAIYYHQNKVDFKEHKELENPLTLIIKNTVIDKKQYMVSFIHDSRTNELKILEAMPKDFSYIDSSLNEDIQRAKKIKPDGITLLYLARAINNANQYGDINICVPPLVTAAHKKVTAIPVDLQEEFFALHKAIDQYPSKITMTPKWSSLDNKIKECLQVFQEKQIVQDVVTNMNNKIRM